jgi:Zn-dependent peptidase ImmA (M78 family)
VLQQHLGKPVKLVDLDVPVPSFKATYIALENPVRYDILMLAGLTEAEKRIALCKELFHVLLDHDSARSTDVFAHLEEMVAGTFTTQSKSADWEHLAEAAAMEFLFPFSDREAACPGPDCASLAERYGIPQEYVELYCSSGYMDNFRAYRAE